MIYKVGGLTFNIIVENNDDKQLFSNFFTTFNGGQLNKIYQKQFGEYLGRDAEIGIRWISQTEIKEQLQDLNLENLDTDLDFLLNEHEFTITAIDDIAVIIKLFSDFYKHSTKEPIINIKCSHYFEFFFVLALSNNVDTDNVEDFYDNYYYNYNNYSNAMVKAYRLMSDSGHKHLFNKELYTQIENDVDLMFDLPFESKELFDEVM